jgi:hypothetical protein
VLRAVNSAMMRRRSFSGMEDHPAISSIVRLHPEHCRVLGSMTQILMQGVSKFLPILKGESWTVM